MKKYYIGLYITCIYICLCLYIGNTSYANICTSNLNILSGSTFIGGDSADSIEDIAIDSAGNIFVVGNARGTYPTTVGAYDRTIAYTYNAGFVSKFNNSLTELLASTFLLGNGTSELKGIDIDNNGMVYVVGASSAQNYPTSVNAYNTSNAGGGLDVVVTKLYNGLTGVAASTFIGGTDIEEGRDIKLDNQKNIFIVGYSLSNNYPYTVGAFDTTNTNDGIISKFNNSLSTLLASTFIGTDSYSNNSSDILLTSIIINDQDNSIYVAGGARENGYPTTNGYDTSFNNTPSFGRGDGVVSKLNKNLTTLLASTYIGGNKDDIIYDLKMDSMKNIFVVGRTISPNYPTIANAYDTSFNTGVNSAVTDGFISKFNSSLSSLLSSTYVGGTGNEELYSIYIDTKDNVYVAGHTRYGTGAFYPTTPGAYDTTYNGMDDGVVSKFTNGLTGVIASSFIGGNNRDEINGITMDANGSIFVAGRSRSSNYPTLTDAYDTSYNGTDNMYNDSGDGIVSKFGGCTEELPINGVCGTSHLTTSQTTPINLCSVGIASAVSQSGSNRIWSCNGINNGASVSCFATSPSNGSCGPSHNGFFSIAPSTGLCNTGSPSLVSQSGLVRNWSCNGANNGASSSCSALLPLNGSCGSSHNGFFSIAPSTGLCNTGSPSLVSQSGLVRNWSCNGANNGASSSCSALLPLNGSCGPSHNGFFSIAPSTGLCNTGSPSLVSQSGLVRNWSCNGANNGASSSCSALLPLNGSCGSSHNGFFSTAPSTGLCNAGSPSLVYQAGLTRNWSCNGINNGASSNCSALLPLNGSCGPSHNGFFSTAPSTGLCNAGSPSSVSQGEGNRTWSCNGMNNGSSAFCMSVHDEIQQAYNFAYENNLTSLPQEDSRPYDPILRYEAAIILSNFSINILKRQPDTTRICFFSDIGQLSENDRNSVIMSCQLGVMGLIADGRPDIAFRPMEYMTREMFLTTLSRMLYDGAYNTKPGEPHTMRSVHHVQKLKDETIVTQTSASELERYELRGYIWIMLDRVRELLQK